MEVLAESTATTLINAPVEAINLADWLFTLKDDEYQACSSAHIAGGASFSSKGKRMSINVEKVGESLLVQHYVEEISNKDHCRVNSHSDSLSPSGNTKLGVTWELKVKGISSSSCEFSNHVIVSLTTEFAAMLAKANITDLDPVKTRMQNNLELHNREETPLFAKDIEAKAKKNQD
jgi:hypothetical protein